MQDKSIQMGGFGLAHVWFQCYEEKYNEKRRKHCFRQKPNPDLTRMKVVSNSGVFLFLKRRVYHTRSYAIKYPRFPYFILDNNSVIKKAGHVLFMCVTVVLV